MFFLLVRIDELKRAKLPYYPIIEIVQKAIPLFPPGALQPGSDGLKSLMLRYQTLLETKQQFQRRDYTKEVRRFSSSSSFNENKVFRIEITTKTTISRINRST